MAPEINVILVKKTFFFAYQAKLDLMDENRRPEFQKFAKYSFIWRFFTNVKILVERPNSPFGHWRFLDPYFKVL